MFGRFRAFALTGAATLAVAGGAYGASAATTAVFVGGPGNNTIYGTVHGDAIYGKGGNDDLHGRAGNDVLIGGEGNDVLRGGHDSDVLRGGPGDDTLWGGFGADVELGGPGNDTLYALANDNRLDVLDCGPGDDTAHVNVHERGRYRIARCEHVDWVDPSQAQLAEESSD